VTSSNGVNRKKNDDEKIVPAELYNSSWWHYHCGRTAKHIKVGNWRG